MIPSRREDLLQPSDGMHQALFTIEPSNKLIHEVSNIYYVFQLFIRYIPAFFQSTLTLRECDMATTESIAGIFCYCCWNNQSFSACVIGDLQVHYIIYIYIYIYYIHVSLHTYMHIHAYIQNTSSILIGTDTRCTS